MAGINISEIASKNTPVKKRQRKIYDLSTLSKNYSNPKRTNPSVNETSMKRQSTVNETSMNTSKKKSKRSNRESTVNQAFPTVNETSMKRESTVNDTSMKFNHELLTKFQIEIGLYLIKNHQLDSSKSTERVNTPLMIKVLQSSCGSVRSSILQMKKNNCFEFVVSKKYHRKFTLSESFFYYLENLQKTSSVNETSTKRESSVNQPLAHTSMNASSSSSNILNTITTDKILEEIQTPQNLKSLGFGIGHIRQLKEKFNLSADEIQKNLESFAYDLDNGEFERLKGRGIQNIIGYFFGAMKSGGYNSVINGFIPAEELAEQEMLERLERKKRERKEREIKLAELLFEEWLETKTKDDLMVIQSPMVNYMDSFHKAALKGYFVDNELEKFKKDFQ